MTSRLAALAVSTIVILSIGLVGGETAAAATDLGPFTDDDGHPGEPYLEWLAERGIVHGCNPPANTRICPDRALSRAEAAKIVIGTGRYAGTLPPFPSGLPDRFIGRTFHPTSPLLRGQVAKILVGTLDLEAPSSYITPWTDTAGRFYHEAARVTAFLRIWDDSTGIFRGGSEVTRAEFAHAIVVALGEDACPVTPFTEARADSLRRRYPGQLFTAYAYDTRTGCAYWMNPEARPRTASVFKVMVMAGTLLEAQGDARPISSWERSQMVPMITESANDPVRALWRNFGGSPWFREQVESFGLDQTRAVGDSESGWGRTTTSAKDQADLIRQVLLGDWGPIEEAYRDQAWNLMTSVVPSQTWGITNGVPADWVVAQKNGFAGHIANSVGFVRQPDGGEGYVVAVLSNGWSDWARGVPTLEEISGWVSAALAR